MAKAAPARERPCLSEAVSDTGWRRARRRHRPARLRGGGHPPGASIPTLVGIEAFGNQPPTRPASVAEWACSSAMKGSASLAKRRPAALSPFCA